jgi:hypothetical protein
MRERKSMLRNPRAIALAIVGFAVFMNTASAEWFAGEKKHFVQAYVIENDQQAQLLLEVLREMTSKDLGIVKSHHKTAVEGFVESLRNYAMANYKTLDVTRIGTTEQELHELQTKALEQLACNEKDTVNAQLKNENSKAIRILELKWKHYQDHIARAKRHSKEAKVFNGGKELNLQCEMGSEELANIDKKIQTKRALLGLSTEQGLASVSQSKEKAVSNEVTNSTSSSLKSVVGK